MKKFLLKSCAVSILINGMALRVHSQALSVTDEKVKTEEGANVDSWTVHLDQDVNAAEETFSDFIEKAYKFKVDKRTKTVYVVEKARFPEVINIRVDVRAIFQSEPGGRTVSFVFSPGYDVHVGHELYPDQFQLAQAFAKSYARFHYTLWYDSQVKSFNDKIKNNDSEINSEENKIDKAKSYIAENETKINGGDPSSVKLKDKNRKYSKEIDDRTNHISSMRKANTNFQAEIEKARESLKIVGEFK